MKPPFPTLLLAGVFSQTCLAATRIEDVPGKVLLAWVEGTGWNRGGVAAGQELDEQLHPTGPRAPAGPVPAWGRVAVYAEPTGEFVLLR